MLIKIYPQNPNEREIDKALQVLNKGGVIIFPTDTVYGLGCDIFQHKAVERVAQIKGVKLEKADFSFLFADLSHLSEYTTGVSTPVFKLMKKNLPGPFTFILPASNNIPKIFKGKKKTIGIRVPNNPITLELVRKLGHPMLTTSVHDEDEILEYTTDPELIHEKYGEQVDLVIDGGFGQLTPSTVIDCTGDEPVVIRTGLRLPEL